MRTIITDIGIAAFAQAQANSINVTITHMAAGDLSSDEYMNFTLYDGAETALSDEKSRVEVNRVFIDPEDNAQVIFEAIVSSVATGFYLREVGLFDDTGNLIAISKHPETYVPPVDAGVSVDNIIQLYIKLENAENVNVAVNLSAALATQEYVLQMLLGQAASAGIRDLKLSEEMVLLKTKI